MDLAYLERLIELLGRSPIEELELAQDGWRVRLVKARTGAASGPETLETPAAEPLPEASQRIVAAGVTGTFYRAPAPGRPPYVAVGDAVHEGQTLGMMEAMKTFIPIEAEAAGRVEAVLQEDGAPVQAGEALFAIGPAD